MGDVVKADVGSPAFRTLASVMAPGVLLLGELYAFVKDVDTVDDALTALPKKGFALAVVVLVGFILLAFVIGFIGRRLAFTLLHDAKLETVGSVRAAIGKELGEKPWDRAFEKHREILESIEASSDSGFWLFLYCKEWLKLHCAGMAGLERETEVNVFAALLWPTILAPAAAVRLLELDGCLAMAAAIVLGIGLAVLDGWLVRKMFRDDVRDGIRTFVLVNSQPPTK